MQIQVEQVLFRSLLAGRLGLSPGGYLLLLAGLAERRESEGRPRDVGDAACKGYGSRAPMEDSEPASPK